MSSSPIAQNIARDPIAAAIENCLHYLQSVGKGELQFDPGDSQIGLTFGAAQVRAETYDIALVRLANALLDDGCLRVPLIVALRRPIHLAEARSAFTMARAAKPQLAADDSHAPKG